jgi:hypothetical protein
VQVGQAARWSLWVILNEECEQHRFAERDLDLIESRVTPGRRHDVGRR